MTTEESQKRLTLMQGFEHPDCFLCSPGNELGLQMAFRVCADGSVAAWFTCDQRFQGYSGFIHGGVISSLLDSAMANCLFSQGKAGFTAELNIRFVQPVITGQAALVRAWITDSFPPLYIMAAYIHQNCRIVVRATGKFMEREQSDGSNLQACGKAQAGIR